MIPAYKKYLLFILFLLAGLGESIAQNNKMQITGDSLKQIEENGMRYREVIGKVIITQGNLKINCDKAIHYFEKGEAELIGNVIAVQDTISIKTPRGYYYEETRTTFSEWGIELNDSHYTLKAKKGYYYFNEKKADFTDDVSLTDRNSVMRAKNLSYFREENKAVAVGSVMIADTSSVIYADSLEHFREKKVSHGFRNVKIFNPKNRTVILSNEFRNIDSTGYASITGKPLFVQVDTTADGKQDTLYISARTMEAYQDSTDRFVATDSVKMFRSNFAALNNLTTLFRKEDKIFTYRLESDLNPPVIWYEDSQMFGDSITLGMKEKKLKLIEVVQNAFMLSLNEGQQFRYDQMSGRKILIHFTEGEINRIDVDGALLSIYYLYEEKEPNGLVKASSERGKMFFKEKKIDDVKLYGSVVSEYHPENVILGKEKDFTLPGFIIYPAKPRREDFLTDKIKDALKLLDEIIINKDGKYPNLKK